MILARVQADLLAVTLLRKHMNDRLKISDRQVRMGRDWDKRGATVSTTEHLHGV